MSNAACNSAVNDQPKQAPNNDIMLSEFELKVARYEAYATGNTSGPFSLLLSLYVVSLYLQQIYSRSCSIVTFRSLDVG